MKMTMRQILQLFKQYISFSFAKIKLVYGFLKTLSAMDFCQVTYNPTFITICCFFISLLLNKSVVWCFDSDNETYVPGPIRAIAGILLNEPTINPDSGTTNKSQSDNFLSILANVLLNEPIYKSDTSSDSSASRSDSFSDSAYESSSDSPSDNNSSDELPVSSTNQPLHVFNPSLEFSEVDYHQLSVEEQAEYLLITITEKVEHQLSSTHPLTVPDEFEIIKAVRNVISNDPNKKYWMHPTKEMPVLSELMTHTIEELVEETDFTIYKIKSHVAVHMSFIDIALKKNNNEFLNDLNMYKVSYNIFTENVPFRLTNSNETAE